MRHGAGRADRGVHLVGPDVAALQAQRRLRVGRRHVAALSHHARLGGVGAQGAGQVLQRRLGGPVAPVQPQGAHRGLGLFFALGHDADEVALAHDGHQARQVGHRGLVHGAQRAADELAMVGARVRRAHHAAVQHAGQAHVVYEGGFAQHLGGDVHARQAFARHRPLGAGFQRRGRVQHQADVLATQQGGDVGDAAFGRLRPQPGARLRGGALERVRGDLQRGAGDGGALVGRPAGVAQQHDHALKGQLQFLGHQLAQRGGDAGAQVHLAAQAVGAAVVPQRQQDLHAFGRVARHHGRLAGGGWRRWGRVAHHQQHALGFEEAGAGAGGVGGAHGGSDQAPSDADVSARRWAARCTACRISTCAPQRHRLCDRASRICASVGSGQRRSKATVAITMPLVQ